MKKQNTRNSLGRQHSDTCRRAPALSLPLTPSAPISQALPPDCILFEMRAKLCHMPETSQITHSKTIIPIHMSFLIHYLCFRRFSPFQCGRYLLTATFDSPKIKNKQNKKTGKAGQKEMFCYGRETRIWTSFPALSLFSHSDREISPLPPQLAGL